VEEGETIGIIGSNGAGKSTLLKILSRITDPTDGTVRIRGRIASLLEVGSGFHPELTGRENIYLNGSILGMRKTELDKKFDEIVAFADVGQFLDTPVKRYSSGMYVRLAFSVAAHLDPEILIVDEVLAVGDAAFQKKCLAKMSAVAQSGRTVLLVSHSMAAVQRLCSRVLLLRKGRAEPFSSVEQGIQAYMDTALVREGTQVNLSEHPSRRQNSKPLLQQVRFLDQHGRSRQRFFSGEPLKVELTFNPLVPLADPQFGIGVDDSLGARIFSVATYLSSSQLPELNCPGVVTCQIDELPLAPGRYMLSFSAGTRSNPVIDAIEHAVSIEVEDSDYYGNGRISRTGLGKVLVRSTWSAQC
jgi:lipopolysaccharide transport system ATP-binding protein